MSRARSLGAAAPCAVAAALFGVFGVFGAAGCPSDELEAYAEFDCPSQAVFEASVSPYIERRCGTLDCHGIAEQPMRLYSVFGLRKPVPEGQPANIPGGPVATTPAEVAANYASVCGVEPEAMHALASAGSDDAEQTLLMQKARGERKHKGGAVHLVGDRGDSCLLFWLQGLPVEQTKAECEAAISALGARPF